jgi:hypothetical protein
VVLTFGILAMKLADRLHPQYVSDSTGRHTAVILPIGEFTELLEDIDDLVKIAERIDEPTVPHASVVAELR